MVTRKQVKDAYEKAKAAERKWDQSQQNIEKAYKKSLQKQEKLRKEVIKTGKKWEYLIDHAMRMEAEEKRSKRSL